jgi:hypothetical protein
MSTLEDAAQSLAMAEETRAKDVAVYIADDIKESIARGELVTPDSVAAKHGDETLAQAVAETKEAIAEATPPAKPAKKKASAVKPKTKKLKITTSKDDDEDEMPVKKGSAKKPPEARALTQPLTEDGFLYVCARHINHRDEDERENFEALLRYLQPLGKAETFGVGDDTVYKVPAECAEWPHKNMRIMQPHSSSYYYDYNDDRTLISTSNKTPVVMARTTFLRLVKDNGWLKFIQRNKSGSDWRYFIGLSMAVEGIHFGDKFTEEECKFTAFSHSKWGKCLAYSYEGKLNGKVVDRTLVFVENPVAEKHNINKYGKLMREVRENLRMAMPQLQDVLQRRWIAAYAGDVQGKLETAEKDLRKHQMRVVALTGSVVQLRRVAALLDKSVNEQISNYRDVLGKAGLKFTHFVDRGMVFRTGPLFVDIGEHDTADDPRYLGDFALLITPDGSCALRNMAASKSSNDGHHPYFNHDGACIGNYHDVLKHSVAANDLHTYAMTLLAMLTHFDEGRRTYFNKLPKTQPKTTVEVAGWVNIYGDATSFQGATNGDDYDDEDIDSDDANS